MQGSTSPWKNGLLSHHFHVTFCAVSAVAAATASSAGSIPKSRSHSSVSRQFHSTFVESQPVLSLVPPHDPSGACSARRAAPQPSLATRRRSAATILTRASVRSRSTCQRIAGSESINHSRTLIEETLFDVGRELVPEDASVVALDVIHHVFL